MSYNECLPSSFGLRSLGGEGLPLAVSVKCFVEIFLDFEMLKYFRLPRSCLLLRPVVCMERSGVLYHWALAKVHGVLLALQKLNYGLSSASP